MALPLILKLQGVPQLPADIQESAHVLIHTTLLFNDLANADHALRLALSFWD